jgi:hypothetical protein
MTDIEVIVSKQWGKQNNGWNKLAMGQAPLLLPLSHKGLRVAKDTFLLKWRKCTA